MIRVTKDGTLVSSRKIDLPAMEYGCHFSGIKMDGDTLVLYGGVNDIDHAPVATVAVINVDAEVLWYKQYPQFKGIGALGILEGRYYMAVVGKEYSEVKILVDAFDDRYTMFENPIEKGITAEERQKPINIRNFISDGNGGLWLIGTVDNATGCYIAKLIE